MTPARVHLFCRFMPPDMFLKLLDSILLKFTGGIWEFLPACVRAFEGRFRRDNETREKAFIRLEAGATAEEKTNLSQLLRRTDNRFDRLQTWARTEIENQYKGKLIPDSALDIYKGQIRPLAHVLMELLLN